MVTGSPGGRTIINTVLETIVDVVDFGMNAQEAVDAPRFHHQWLPDRIRLRALRLLARYQSRSSSGAATRCAAGGAQGVAQVIDLQRQRGRARGRHRPPRVRRRGRRRIQEVAGRLTGQERMREFRLAVRVLWRTPSFAIAAIATFALGMGAATTIFSVVYGVLLRPLPFRDPGRLVVIEAWQDFSGRQLRATYSLDDFREWTDATHTFDSSAFVYVDSESLQTSAGSELVDVDIVSPGFFDVLGGRIRDRQALRLCRVMTRRRSHQLSAVAPAFWRVA